MLENMFIRYVPNHHVAPPGTRSDVALALRGRVVGQHALRLKLMA